jgi:hypothetical protein
MKNVSANQQRTVIVPAGVPIRLLTMGCARSAMKKRGQQKQILKGHEMNAREALGPRAHGL